jgi:hypothetical protein
VPPRRRWSLIALAAIGTGVALFVVPQPRPTVEIVAPADRASRVSEVEIPKRRALGRQRGDLFTSHSWAPPAPPPPPPPQVQQEAAPQPPPNPYRFAGTVEYGGSRKVLLTRDDRIFEVKEGVVLDPGYRVQAVTPHEVTLLYEPLNAPVTVALVFPAGAAEAGASAPPPQPGSR